ncbi:MAG: formylmethanofuran dehydrogenase subunit E family protein [Spirochaetaceae bacterium]
MDDGLDAERILESLRRFHGHLGPFAVVGYRMGTLANAELGADPFGKWAVVKTGIGPPLSCIVDGVQYASGCTLGKGNLRVSHERIPEAVFSTEDAVLTVTLRDEVLAEIESCLGGDIESTAHRMFARPDDVLFSMVRRAAPARRRS